MLKQPSLNSLVLFFQSLDKAQAYTSRTYFQTYFTPLQKERERESECMCVCECVCECVCVHMVGVESSNCFVDN